MKKIHTFISLVIILMPLLSYSQSEKPSPTLWENKEIFQLNLKDSSLINKEIKIFSFIIPPGATTTNAHSHDAYVIGYVIEGSVETKMKDRDAQVLNAGGVFYEYPNEVHEHIKNLDTSKPAKVVLYYLANKGSVLTKAVQ